MNFSAFLFSFNGRITRKAWWLYVLASFVLGLLVNFMLPQPAIDPTSVDPAEALGQTFGAMPAWYWLYSLVMLYIGLAVNTKRWHDQDRSGWWNLLLLLTPLLLIGPLIMLVMLGFIGGTPGPNRYGEGPMV